MEAVLVGPLVLLRHLDVRGLVERRIFPEEIAQRLGPGLVAQQVDLGDDADRPLPAGLDELLDVGFREGVFIA